MPDFYTNMKGNHIECNGDECRIFKKIYEDDQDHFLKCPSINAGKCEQESEYSDIFVNDVTKEIIENMSIREAFKNNLYLLLCGPSALERATSTLAVLRLGNMYCCAFLK